MRVNALAPGIVATPLTRPIAANPMWNEAYAKRCALGRWAEAEEMAGPIIFLASDASSYLTGTTLSPTRAGPRSTAASSPSSRPEPVPRSDQECYKNRPTGLKDVFPPRTMVAGQARRLSARNRT